MIRIASKFSDDIGMSFGIDKCKKFIIQWGKTVHMENIQLDNDEELKSLELNQQYKYLGFGESLTIDKTTKSALKNEYFKRLKMILKSELSCKHTFEAINSYAIPALLCAFPVLNWTITELEIIDRKTRKMLQQYHAMHSQSDVIQLYIPRKNGGRGLINITSHCKNAITNLSSYLLNSEEQFLKLTWNWHVTRGEKSIHQKAQWYCDEIGHDIQQLPAMRKLQRKITIKSAHINKLEAELKERICVGNLQDTLTNLMSTKSDPTNG